MPYVHTDRAVKAVLDVNTGTWARILPSGDPGKDGSETFPTPRDGAAVVGYSLALVGGSRATSSDYLVSCLYSTLQRSP